MSRILKHKDFMKISKLDRKVNDLTTSLNDLIREGSSMGFPPDVSVSCFWPDQKAPVIKVWFFKDFDSIQNE